MIISSDELEALAALDLARERVSAAVPDIVERQGGEIVSYASANSIDEAARPVLRELCIELEFCGSRLVGGVGVATTWTWRCGKWRSEPIVIEVFVEQRTPASSSAAITSGEKALARHLLRIKQGRSEEAELATANDDMRDAMHPRVKRLLAGFCRANKMDEASAIRIFTNFDPQGCAPTFEMLPAPMVAVLAYRLLMQPGVPSKGWDPGAKPAGVDELPESMRGVG